MTDYRQMWTDLDMDLETHDQLCAVLPAAFGDTYLSQENLSLIHIFSSPGLSAAPVTAPR